MVGWLLVQCSCHNLRRYLWKLVNQMRELKAYRQTFGCTQHPNSEVLHIGFNVEPEMLTAIKRFRDKNKFKSTSQALRELVNRGLRAK